MKRVPIITNFKRLIYQTFNLSNLTEKWYKTHSEILYRSICDMFEVWDFDNNQNLTLQTYQIPEMNTSRKVMEWFICFSIINLMLGCLLFKKSKKFNESCSLPKAARVSSTYL